ncbi:MAG: toprim domain-containing protein, partial [Oscillospiraceae bacterium]
SNIVLSKFNSYNNINVFVDRTNMKYEERGRTQTLDESKQKDVEIKTFLKNQDIPFETITKFTARSYASDFYNKISLTKNIENKEEEKMRKTPKEKDFVSKEQIQKAKETDLLQYITDNGYTLKNHGTGTFKLVENGHDSVVIFPSHNSWFDYVKGVGGDILSFLQNHENMEFVEAVRKLNGEEYTTPKYSFKEKENINRPRENMVLPPQDENNNRVFAYLIKTRKIDRDVVKDCIDKGIIYQSKEVIPKGDKTYTFNNCIFVGTDNKDNPMYASQRSMNDDKMVFKADVKNSNKEYGFCLRGNNNAKWLTICEAPIDALSIASLNKMNGNENKDEHILSLGGVSDKALDRFLQENAGIEVINICLDNDKAGRENGEKIKEKYLEQGLKVILNIKIIIWNYKRKL